VADIEKTGAQTGTGVVVPTLLGTQITEWFGAAGEAWLEALPGKVAAVAERWNLRVHGDAPFPDGHVSWAAPALRRDGRGPAVLKIPYLDLENLHEAAALRDYAGEGAVLLYEHDAESGAMLLERLSPGTAVSDLPVEEAVDIACGILRRLRRIPPADHPYMLVESDTERWIERLDRAAREGHAFLPRELAERAARVARELIADDARMLVNSDPHLGNFLRAEREPWLMIDPKPLVGDPAFDAGFLLFDAVRTDPSPRRAADCAGRIADGLGVDLERVRGWGLVRAAENCLWETGEFAEACLTLAKSLAWGERGAP
jgi:streptomycin 6-kinase